MSVTVFECDVDNEHFWIASLSLGSTMANYLLEKAKKEGRCPLGIGELANEMVDYSEVWCAENCSGDYRLDPTYRLEIWFNDPNDAMRFKLTHG